MANNTTGEKAAGPLQGLTDGAFGAGLVLVVLPSIALIAGVPYIAKAAPAVGLPLLAIFGIMMLFGALALVAALFSKLDLVNRNEALALPTGSIRAAIALSLIVLFALISVMLYQSQSATVSITGVGEAQKNALLLDPARHVTDVIPTACPAAAVASAVPAASAASDAASAPAGTASASASPGCVAGAPTFTVVLQQPPTSAASDMAKQLLILIGTLMTSVTSFYFGSRSSEVAATRSATALKAAADAPPAASTGDTPAPLAEAAASTDGNDASHASDSHVDGCDLPIADPTDDADLPPAQGGVA